VNVSIEIPEFFEIDADKKFFSQALINLIKNAFENKDTTYINIYLQNGSLFFENNGVKQNLETEKIFEPYYTTKTKGSGLGLAILKKVIEAHNWDIICHKNKNIIKFEINFFI
jgi:signal transduction histidine kinase